MDDTNFNSNVFNEARNHGHNIELSKRQHFKSWNAEMSRWANFVHFMNERDLLPVVVFVFSKKRCDMCASSIENLELTTADEKSKIHLLMSKSKKRLHGTDRELPQLQRIGNLMKNGIGVHHAGLLPIVKEVVEMCFARGLIKILFATETFAMGVNFPARSVMFQSLRKHDGRNFRDLLPGEFTQMAGRAGRRGIDEFGTVIVNCKDNDIPEENTIKHILTGSPTKLASRFRLTYNMILNLLRVEDLRVEDMIKRSFSEFHSQQSIPDRQAQLDKGTARLDAFCEINCIFHNPRSIEEYHSLSVQIRDLSTIIMSEAMMSQKSDRVFCPGRILLIRMPTTTTLGVCVLLKSS